MNHTIEDVRRYWDSHLNLTQFVQQPDTAVGSDEFYRLLEASLRRYDYKPRLLADFAAGHEGEKLLEIGCGLGVELAHLGRLGFHVTGVDLAPTAVAHCNNYLARQRIEGEAVVDNAEQMQFPAEHFDAVYSCGVLQHTPDIERAIDEVWRVLKPGGRILIILYHRHSWFYWLHRLSGMNVEFDSDEAPIVNTYTRKEMRELFGRFRGIRIDCEYYYPSPTPRRGALPFLFNHGFVPFVRSLPRKLVRPIGWHLVLTAEK